MSTASYLAAVSCIAAVVGSAVLFGQAIRRRLVPDWTGSTRALAVFVLAYVFVIVIAEALGTAGQLRRIPLVVTTAAIATTARIAFPPHPRETASKHRVIGYRATPPTVAASVCAAMVGAQLLVAIHGVGTTGITFIDSVEYHLTFAAHFAATGRTTGLIHVSPGDATAYYPLNDELLNGVGMVLAHRDSLSLLLTSMDLGAAMLAAYAFGAEFGAGALAVCAITPLLAVLGTIDASAPNDWAALWPMLAAIAFLTHASSAADRRPSLRGLAMVGLAAGLAAGAKLDLLAPSIALGLGALFLSRRRAWRSAVIMLAGGMVGGGYWYVRDLVAVGSPLPALHIPGLPRVPLSGDRGGFTVAHYLGNAGVWHQDFVPGLRLYFGDGWPAILALVGLGVGAALIRRHRPILRVLAVIAIVNLAVYVVTPASAGGAPGLPVSFWENLRYALPVTTIGILLVVVATSLRRRPALTSAIFVAVLAVTLSWRFAWHASDARDPAIAAAVGLIIARLGHAEPIRRHSGAIALAAAAAVLVGGYPLQQHYLHDRYRDSATPLDALVSQLSATHGQRIGVMRIDVPVEFPFEGPTLANIVGFVGQPLPHHAFENYTSCPAWRHAVSAGRYNLVVIESAGGSWPDSLGWTRSDPLAQRRFRNAAGAIFTIHPGFSAIPCPARNLAVA